MALWRMPVSGGEESQVLPSVVWRGFSLVDDGIYFIPGAGADGKYSIQFLSFVTGTVKTVAPIPRPSWLGMTVSPDRRHLLYTQLDESRQRPDAGGELPVKILRLVRLKSNLIDELPHRGRTHRPCGHIQ